MNYLRINLISLKTIIRKEYIRITRIWIQTLIPPAITMALYFLIFGRLVGSRLGNIENVTYMEFIVPGLVLMSIITNAYNNVVSSFYSIKFQRNVEELLVTPTSEWVIVLGFTIGGVVRGLLVGVIVIGISLFFSPLRIHHPGIILSVLLLTSFLFSLAGFFNALFAKSFDDVTIIPTFILTPLTYLGGIFFSVSMLPPFWKVVAELNPILYMVNAFRYGFLGTSDISVSFAMIILVLFCIAFFAINVILMKRGYGIRQ